MLPAIHGASSRQLMSSAPGELVINIPASSGGPGFSSAQLAASPLEVKLRVPSASAAPAQRSRPKHLISTLSEPLPTSATAAPDYIVQAPVAAAAPRPRKSVFSEKLSAIADAASKLTGELSKRGARVEEPILVLPSRCFVVGRLESKFPSPVEFFTDKCVYDFHHPFERKQITMVMFYSDMVTPQVKSNNLGFKISHELVQFGADYKHGDSRHVISIGFASTGDAARVRTEILPRIKGHQR